MSEKDTSNRVPPSIPEKKGGRLDVVRFGNKEYPVEYPTSLCIDNIVSNDRVIITTQSGSRYMLRRSRSSGGVVKVYREEGGSFRELGVPIHTSFTLESGKPAIFIIRVSEERGRQTTTTNITKIRVIKGIDSDLNTTKVGGVPLTQALIKAAKGEE